MLRPERRGWARGGRVTLVRLAFTGIGATPSACGAPAPSDQAGHCDQPASVTSRAEPLTNASGKAEYLAASARETEAIGKISAGSPASLCSGVRVDAEWVLTARHCSESPSATFDTEGSRPLDIVDWVRHPDLDMALARVAPDPCEGAAALPVARGFWREGELSRATLAGFGLTEDRRIGGLGFLTEAIIEIDDAAITVDGAGRSGACAGDSGGPLLARDESGGVTVLGVLSSGSSSCLGSDSYVPVAAARDWLAEFIVSASSPSECGGLTARGRCFDRLAAWCEAGQLRAEVCADECGWHAERDAYRCSEEPTCIGDDFGRCDGDRVVTCSAGTETSESCDVACGYEPRTGVARCLE